VGLGFLFLIIFALALFSSYQIQELSKDADTILKDNYASLVYCKNMLLALEDMSSSVDRRFLGSGDSQSAYYSKLFEAGKTTFEESLAEEKANITELHESDFVAELENAYNQYLGLSSQISRSVGSVVPYRDEFPSAAARVRQAIIRINDVNMQAVERKSQSTHGAARRMIISISAFGAFSIVLAFFYFWYFSFYVSSVISFLAGKMKGLLQDLELKSEPRTRDEAVFLSTGMDLIARSLAKKTRKRR
jgi:hypothetical protein